MMIHCGINCKFTLNWHEARIYQPCLCDDNVNNKNDHNNN